MDNIYDFSASTRAADSHTFPDTPVKAPDPER